MTGPCGLVLHHRVQNLHEALLLTSCFQRTNCLS